MTEERHRLAAPPSQAHRVVTGFLALAFAAAGVLALAELGDFALALGLPVLAAGALMALATFVPFGKLRRVLVGLGGASIGFGASVGLFGAGALFLGPILGGALFYAAYRASQ